MNIMEVIEFIKGYDNLLIACDTYRKHDTISIDNLIKILLDLSVFRMLRNASRHPLLRLSSDISYLWYKVGSSSMK